VQQQLANPPDSWLRAAQWPPTPPTAYIRIPARDLTPAFVEATSFNRDHVRDDEFAFGYVHRDALTALSDAQFADVVELDAKAWSRASLRSEDLAAARRSDGNAGAAIAV